MYSRHDYQARACGAKHSTSYLTIANGDWSEAASLSDSKKSAPLTSIGSVARATQVKDQDSTDLEPEAMVSELHADNVAMVKRLKGMKDLAEKAGDNATDGLIDDWTDMAEERAWFLKSTLG